MTDDEIIKAMECCSTDVQENPCPKCAFYNKHRCSTLMVNAVSDLISRYKAKNESLKQMIDERDKETLKLQKRIIFWRDNLNYQPEKIKSEAIKEFAEELEYFVLNEDIEVVKPKCKDYESYINGANQFRHQIKNGINNLVKESKRNDEIKERF